MPCEKELCATVIGRCGLYSVVVIQAWAMSLGRFVKANS
ncbi:unnamed protein product, partial [marine sediment metagenome]